MIAPKRMASGKYIDLMNLTVDDIDLDDINVALNWTYRFNGHHKDNPPLTVAQHTWLCCDLATQVFPGEDDVWFDCLLHDMPEAYYGDISTPFKRALGADLKKITNPIDCLLYEKLWGELPENYSEIASKRKVCDLLALDIERRSMWIDQRGKDLWPETPDVFNVSLKRKQSIYDDLRLMDFVDLKALYKEKPRR